MNELDALFGFKYVFIGDSDSEDSQPTRYMMRVMLTRTQAKIVDRASVSIGELQVRMRDLTAKTTELANDRDAQQQIVDDLEIEVTKICVSLYNALDAMIIDLPAAYAELSFAALGHLYRQLVARQATELAAYVRVEADHPTVASNAS